MPANPQQVSSIVGGHTLIKLCVQVSSNSNSLADSGVTVELSNVTFQGPEFEANSPVIDVLSPNIKLGKSACLRS